MKWSCTGLLASAACLFQFAPIAHAGAYIFAGEQFGPDLVAHPNGWSTSTRGELRVRICISPGTPNAGVMTKSVENIVDRFNLGVATVGNVRLGNDNDLNASEIDFESTAIHEVGHCLGLAHPNLASESGQSGEDRNYTKSTDGSDNSFNLGLGNDGVRGSPDDVRGDDVNLHWFEIDVNDPFDVAETVDEENYSNKDLDLPSADEFAANGDRAVAVLLGYPSTEAIMQQGAFFDEDQRALSADDIATLKFARTGRDRQADTGDDYQVVLEYGGISSSSQCDINLAFDDMETGFAVCQTSASVASNDYASFVSSDSYFNTGFNWHFSSRRIPYPAPDAIVVSTLGTATELTTTDNSLLANDVDQTTGQQGLVVSSQPSRDPQHGVVTLAEDGTFSYTNTNDKATADDFQYRVCVDNTNPPETTCAHQNVAITIVNNGPPTAQDDNLELAEGSQTSMLANGGNSLLDNDSDPDGAAGLVVTTQPVTSPAHGTLTLEADGAFTYMHNGSEQFSDAFDYEVCDNFGLCDIGATTVVISEVNDAPLAVNDPLPPRQEDTDAFTTPIASLLQNDSAGEGETAQSLSLSAISNTVGGSVTVEGSSVRFAPDPDYFGPAGYTYTVEDDGTTNGQPDPKTTDATVSFSISEVNDPPVATSDELPPLLEDAGEWVIAMSMLTGNDSPGPVNESTQTLAVVAINNPVGLAVSIAGGSLSLLPEDNFNGQASFEYVVSDNGTTGGAADPLQSSGLASLSIWEANDLPEPANDFLADIPEGSDPVQVTWEELLDNDHAGPANESDQTLTLIGVSNVQGGGLSVSGATATWTFDPEYSGIATFDYTVEDNGTTMGAADPRTATGSVFLTVVGQNDDPVARDDVLGAQSSGDLKLITTELILANDTPGPEAEATQTISVVEVFAQAGGSATLSDNLVRFAVEENFTGTAEFIYRIEDNGTTNGLPDFRTAQGRVTFPVTDQNLAPIALPDTLSVRRGNVADRLDSLSASVAENDSDPNGDDLIVTITPTAGPSEGSITLSSDGSFLYEHGGGQENSDSFSYEICDAATDARCTSAEVLVTIADENPFSCTGSVRTATVGVPAFITFLEAFPSIPLTFTASGLPSGLDLGENGIISGTPGLGDASVQPYEVLLTGTSESGAEFAVAFSLLVTVQPDIVFYTGHERRCEL